MRDHFLIAPLSPSYAPAGIPDYIILRAFLRLFFRGIFWGKLWENVAFSCISRISTLSITGCPRVREGGGLQARSAEVRRGKGARYANAQEILELFLKETRDRDI